MLDDVVEEFAFANLPSSICQLTGRKIDEPAVMHRDLSDWWPSELLDMRDERLINLMIVERSAREAYYKKLKETKIVLAFSGGLDSTTVLFWARRIFGGVHCLLFDYGQRHRIELAVAERLLKEISGKDVVDDSFSVLTIDSQGVHRDIQYRWNQTDKSISWDVVNMSPITRFAASALTRDNIAVPKNSYDSGNSSIPNTFVPGRNIYFLTALAQAAFQLGTRHIAVGVNALDYSGYPDCRPQFISMMRNALSAGIFNGLDIGLHAPLMFLNKTKIIRLGLALGVDYSKTHSCYEGVAGGCRECDSCIIRQNAFTELGLFDPVAAFPK